jgi:hypothetical protein
MGDRLSLISIFKYQPTLLKITATIENADQFIKRMHIFPSHSSQKKLQSMHANMPNEKRNRQHSAGLFRLKIILTRKSAFSLQAET